MTEIQLFNFDWRASLISLEQILKQTLKEENHHHSFNSDHSMSSYYYLFKFIIIGDSDDLGVGKSCIVLRFTENMLKLTHDITIGVEYGTKIVKVEDKNIKIQIWDTAGQENFRSITRSYYRTAIGAFLVYDISKRQTFSQINHWINEIKTNGNPYLVTILIGNKSDKEKEREVKTEEGQAFADENGFLFLETSAYNSTNISESFQELARNISNKIDENIIPLIGNVHFTSVQFIHFFQKDKAIKIGSEYNHSPSGKKQEQKERGEQISLKTENVQEEQKKFCC